jgi:hypothetical protein
VIEELIRMVVKLEGVVEPVELVVVELVELVVVELVELV